MQPRWNALHHAIDCPCQRFPPGLALTFTVKRKHGCISICALSFTMHTVIIKQLSAFGQVKLATHRQVAMHALALVFYSITRAFL